MGNSPIEEYRATADWPYHISSGGIVFRVRDAALEILVLYRNEPDGKHYHLPKGTLHHDETLEDCARREVAEESGATAEIIGYLGALQQEYTWKGLFHDQTKHYFAMEFREMVREHDDEHDGTEWQSLDIARENLAKTEPNKQEFLILDRLEKFLQLTK